MNFQVSQPAVSRREGRAVIHCPLDAKRALTVSIEGPAAVVRKIRPDLTAFLPVAMLIVGREAALIECYGPVDPAYLLNLNASFAPLASEYFGQCAKVTCIAPNEFDKRPFLPFEWRRSGRIGLMFSAGVDSFYSLSKMRQTGVMPDYLININAGAHGKSRACWSRHLRNLRKAANELKLPVIVIDTNFHELINEKHIRCHTIMNLCAAFALKPYIDVFCYSSTYPFNGLSFSHAHTYNNIGHIDPLVSASLTPRPLKVVHIGFDVTRVQKMRAIASEPIAQAYLDVCTNARYQRQNDDSLPMNCGRCAKCVRAIVTLEHLGCLDDFESRFNLAEYRSDQAALVAKLRKSVSPLDAEVAALI